jgi:hypothetical protein
VVEVADAAELAVDGGEPADQAVIGADSTTANEAFADGNADEAASSEQVATTEATDLVEEAEEMVPGSDETINEYLNATEANAPTCEEDEKDEEEGAPEQ